MAFESAKDVAARLEARFKENGEVDPSERFFGPFPEPEEALICSGCPSCRSGEIPTFKSDEQMEEFFLTHDPSQFKGYVSTE